jgi:hypothetical protein
MGLFSGSSKTYVSSVAYNLGGPIEDRPNFLRSVVLQGVLSDSPSLGEDIVGQHITGPGIRQRSFYRWSKTNYPLGVCEAQVFQAFAVDPLLVAAAIPLDAGESVALSAAFIDTGDIIYWAEQWILENQPADFNGVWVVDFDEVTSEMVITFESSPEARVVMPGFDRSAKYVFGYYTLTLADASTTKGVFIYKLGSGNASLDALEETVENIPEIFPIIPLRLDNKPIDHEDFKEDFPSHRRAYAKATGSKISDILASIEENESIEDIDFAFLVHGVELNTVEPIGQRYVFEFLRKLIPNQITTPAGLTDWLLNMLGYIVETDALAAWEEAQSDPADPLYGTERPTLGPREDLAFTRYEVKAQSGLPYEVHIGWVTIDEEISTGLGKPDAKVDDVWFEVLEDISVPGVPFEIGSVAAGSLTRMAAYRQEGPDVYRKLTIYGMYHENFVYNGKSVYITTTEALGEEAESGFIIPLHYPSLLELSLIDSTQLSISNKLIVFNCYKVVKRRWYQSGIFGIIVSIVLSVVFFPAGAGLLGTNLAIGTSLGFTGTSALIVGAIANALAAIVLTTVLEKVSVALLGDKLGALVGTLLSALMMNFSSGLLNGGGFTFNFAELSKAENLLKLTNVISKGVTKYAEYAIKDIQEQYNSAAQDYRNDTAAIEKQRLELLGYGGVFFNPLMLTGTDQADFLSLPSGAEQAESPTAFLTRALLTGGDIAETTVSMVRSFSEISLELPKTVV